MNDLKKYTDQFKTREKITARIFYRTRFAYEWHRAEYLQKNGRK